MTDDIYCYPPDYTVLKNKAGIRDKDALEEFERRHTRLRMLDCPYILPLTYDGYKDIHRYVFQDVYEWAGEPRVVNISKSDMFGVWSFIDQEMQRRFRLIGEDTGLQNAPADQFAEHAAEHLSEINAIHPFREGNGRTQRLFLRNLAHQHSHNLDMRRIDPNHWMEASIQGFRHQNYEPMAECIRGAL